MELDVESGMDTTSVLVGNTVHSLVLKHDARRHVWYARCTATGVWHYGFTRGSAIQKCRVALSEKRE